ncbi:hypothetical protein K7X08_014167 [Anisodus acutangulus]|uniref:Non-haem dioxygenase N-terminal domain-containing protein n=1 Tax=Anisodus acutangulus TaxID=402998 RepID=A0A9Q1R2V2_9SOLA|nr:hypothetical protein K7X08_014167 [Anisodus acutangulus]
MTPKLVLKDLLMQVLVPKIFISPPDTSTNNSNEQFKFPIIDLQGIDGDQINRKEVVQKVRDASETWSFFQVINHGIPCDFLKEMIRCVRSFHEQNTEIKKQWYTREVTEKVVYNSNFDLYSAPATNWRDTFFCIMAPNPPSPEELPPICRSYYQKKIPQNTGKQQCNNVLLVLEKKGLMGLLHCAISDFDLREAGAEGSSSRMKRKRGKSDEVEHHDINSSTPQPIQEGDFHFMPTPGLPQQQQQYEPFGPPTEIESDPDLRPKIINSN